MNKLKELIDNHCPNGVVYKQLKDVANIGTGSSDRKNAIENGAYPFYVRSKDVLRIDTYEFDETAIVIPGEGGIGDIFHYVTGKYALHQRAYRINIYEQGINTKFVYYFMSANFKNFIIKKAVSATVTSIRKPMIENFPIPIPPIEIQEEIVKILDRFAEYAAELQAELQARKKQYEYYRNKLLTFNGIKEGIRGVIWMKMSEIGTFIRGKRFVRTDIVNDGVPCIHYGDMYTYYGLYATKSRGMLRNELAPKMRYAQKNDVVIVAAGENKEDIGIGMAWLGDEPAAVHDACFIFKSDLYPQYVSHYLRTNYYHKQIVKHVSEGKICSISAKGLGNAIIPIPPYEEQVRIATLLNQFDTLVSDLLQGLPAEIAAVQEQYEYYRDKLLSFPKYKLSA